MSLIVHSIPKAHLARESSIVYRDRSCWARCGAGVLRFYAIGIVNRRRYDEHRRESREIMNVQAPIRGIRVVNKPSYRRQSKRKSEREKEKEKDGTHEGSLRGNGVSMPHTILHHPLLPAVIPPLRAHDVSLGRVSRGNPGRQTRGK